ncbi:hypothetical protein DdX_20264 [Ditylenchus destructor]|uniref:Uncharacterized protein n=1 Tax=Ditylenchus destructor TaxID=166010 RepID=A0AAD4MGI2_9BILA|nr:hypothetical protein DdX_20264 [Ditylenchus destructor]
MERFNHIILGKNFRVKRLQPTQDAKRKIIANLEQNLPLPSSENGSVPKYHITLPAGLTNKIFVIGPCLYPDKMDPIASQKKKFHTYFGQFGKVTSVSSRSGNAKISFNNWDSMAKCLQQSKHNICGQEFLVRKEIPTKDLEEEKIRANLSQKNLGANLEQSMPEASHENTSAPNVQSDPPAESNLGNQLPQATASSSSQVQGSVMDYGAIAREWSQRRGLASFDKPGYK